MEDAVFLPIQQKLDAELDAANSAKVGVMVGSDLYAALVDRGLLKAKLADPVLFGFPVPSYSGFFLYHDPFMPDAAYKVGTATT